MYLLRGAEGQAGSKSSEEWIDWPDAPMCDMTSNILYYKQSNPFAFIKDNHCGSIRTKTCFGAHSETIYNKRIVLKKYTKHQKLKD